MPRRIEVFPTWEGGELGRRDIMRPRRRGQFTATNMMVYWDGGLGVRPGLKNQSPSGLVAGQVHSFGHTQLAANDAFFVQGTAVRTFDILNANNLKTSATALTGTPTVALDYCENVGTIYIAHSGDKVYRLVPQTAGNPLVTRLTNSPSGVAITMYNDRIALANITNNINRIRFSGLTAGVPDDTVWSATDFFDIGDAFGIADIAWQRQHLLIAKQYGWYVLTGNLGSGQEVVRRVSAHSGPVVPFDGLIDRFDNYYFGGIGSNWPSKYNGTYPVPFADVNNFTSATFGGTITVPPVLGVTAIHNRGEGGVALITSTGTALYYSNVWTKHTFGVTVSGFTSRTPIDNLVMICDGGGAATVPKFYVWNVSADSPGIEGSAFSRAGDDSTAQISGSASLPEWWSPNLAEVQVRAVIVDFRKWNTGGSLTNHMDVTLQAMRTYEDSDVLSSTASFDEAGSAAGSVGAFKRQRKIFGFSDTPLGNGFQVQFTNCRGIAIDRVQLVLEDHPVRMGS